MSRPKKTAPPAKPLYLVEFPDFGTLPFDPARYGLTDTSWHNDVAPSFSVVNANHVHEETLWLDYAEPAKREMQGRRFLYCTYVPTGDHNTPTAVLADTDDQAALERFLRGRLVERVGAMFASLLGAALSSTDFTTVRERNRLALAMGDTNTCASHDFCDANMVMAEALEKSGLGALMVGDWITSDEYLRGVWNDAWTHAKKAHLTAPNPKGA